MRLKLELDEDTTMRLVECAATERRPLPWQAEVLRHSLGLPFPALEQVGNVHQAGPGLTDELPKTQ